MYPLIGPMARSGDEFRVIREIKCKVHYRVAAFFILCNSTVLNGVKIEFDNVNWYGSCQQYRPIEVIVRFSANILFFFLNPQFVYPRMR